MKIAIASGKGGTGKTTLSTNLAKYLAEDQKVVLVDLDVEEPNSGLFIKGDLVKTEDKFKMVPEWDESKCDLCGICQDVCNFNAILQLDPMINVFPELCHSCYACSELCPSSALPMVPKKMGVLKHYQSQNLNFIESKLEIGEEQAVALIDQTIKYVKKNYSDEIIQIFDAPPGTACPVIEAVKNVDYMILVTEPTPFGYHDLKLAVDTMEQMDKEFAVVINRYGIGYDEIEKYCSREGIEIIAKIPNQRKIAEMYSRGELLYEKIPEFKKELDNVKDFVKGLMLSEVK